MATSLLTVSDPKREFPWLLCAVLRALREDDAEVSIPALRFLDPPSGAIPLISDDLPGLRRVTAEALALAKLDGVEAEVEFDGRE